MEEATFVGSRSQSLAIWLCQSAEAAKDHHGELEECPLPHQLFPASHDTCVVAMVLLRSSSLGSLGPRPVHRHGHLQASSAGGG